MTQTGQQDSELGSTRQKGSEIPTGGQVFPPCPGPPPDKPLPPVPRKTAEDGEQDGDSST